MYIHVSCWQETKEVWIWNTRIKAKGDNSLMWMNYNMFINVQNIWTTSIIKKKKKLLHYPILHVHIFRPLSISVLLVFFNFRQSVKVWENAFKIIFKWIILAVICRFKSLSIINWNFATLRACTDYLRLPNDFSI